MKQFFAEFIAVNGEIKEGDKIINDHGECCKLLKIKDDNTWLTDIHDFDPIYNDSFFTTDPAKTSLAKLFLCSRDIQIGDIIHYEVKNFNNTAVKKDYTFEVNKYNIDDFIKNKAFKIIGEISSKCTWIKKGDKFNENDFQIIYQIYDGALWMNTTKEMFKNYLGKQPKKSFIEILCPTCKIFH